MEQAETKVSQRIVICFLLIVAGIGTMKALAALKQPPTRAEETASVEQVEVILTTYREVETVLKGYGSVHALNRVSIAPEVAGTIVYLHPRLETGECIECNEVLFQIDTRDYEAAVADARARRDAARARLEQLQHSQASEQKRLTTLARSCDLAQAEFERVHDLFEGDQVGSQSRVDHAEQAYNTARDQVDQMSLSLALYPARMREAQSTFTGADAHLRRAQTHLDRCTVRTSFTARLEQVQLEAGQYVSPGTPVLTLADDSLLEIQVPLDGRDVRRWLRFENSSRDTAWLNDVKPVDCSIVWTEDPSQKPWIGQLHRIVCVKKETRTVVAAIRIPAQAARTTKTALPLVDGMFCEVRIPGRPLNNVVALPQWAVSMDQTVYVSRGNRLETVPVSVVRSQDDIAYVDSGLRPGDAVVTTRLIDPLEGTRLEPRAVAMDLDACPSLALNTEVTP